MDMAQIFLPGRKLPRDHEIPSNRRLTAGQYPPCKSKTAHLRQL